MAKALTTSIGDHAGQRGGGGLARGAGGPRPGEARGDHQRQQRTQRLDGGQVPPLRPQPRVRRRFRRRPDEQGRKIALDAASELGFPTVMGSAVGQVWQAAVAQGFGGKGHTAIYAFLEEFTGDDGTKTTRGQYQWPVRKRSRRTWTTWSASAGTCSTTTRSWPARLRRLAGHQRPRRGSLPEGAQAGPRDQGVRGRGGQLDTAITREGIRESVREICERFPDDYWRELDAKREYPEEFVRAMTESGHLGALIPEEYGGMGLGLADTSVILEEINRSGGERPAGPRAGVHDGDPAQARLRGAEEGVPARRSRAARSGCRPSASPSPRPGPTRPP